MKEVIWEYSGFRVSLEHGTQVFIQGGWVSPSSDSVILSLGTFAADLYRQLHPVLPPLPSCPEYKEWERVEMDADAQSTPGDLIYDPTGHAWFEFTGLESDYVRGYVRGLARSRGWVYRLRDKHVEPERNLRKEIWCAAQSLNADEFDGLIDELLVLEGSRGDVTGGSA